LENAHKEMRARHAKDSLLFTLMERDTVEKLMFGFVTGMLLASPKCTIWDALNAFEDAFDIDTENWNRTTAKRAYFRIKSQSNLKLQENE
jgi:hypothetical protein